MNVVTDPVNYDPSYESLERSALDLISAYHKIRAEDFGSSKSYLQNNNCFLRLKILENIFTA